MNRWLKIAMCAAVVCVMSVLGVKAQTVTPTGFQRILIKNGMAERSVDNKANVDLTQMSLDSLKRFVTVLDSLRGDDKRFDLSVIDTMLTVVYDTIKVSLDTIAMPTAQDSLGYRLVENKNAPLASNIAKYLMSEDRFLDLYIAGADTLLPKLIPVDSATLGMTPRQIKRYERSLQPRYSKLFRDSIKIGTVAAISIPVPGFSQIYNGQYWKLPILYSTVGLGVGFGIAQTNIHSIYKQRYNDYIKVNGVRRTDKLDAIQLQMNKYKTNMTLLYGASAVSYVYFLVDGVLNSPQKGVSDVTKATTLAMVCPGAGQIYNNQAWKLPIVLGGFGALIYCIDFNNRGLERFQRAYDNRMANKGQITSADEFPYFDTDQIKTYKNSYRRNRDLCIILTAAFYALQIVDAHASAHMKTYDISDDLSMSLVPTVGQTTTLTRGQTASVGLNFNLTF
ncbi:MAG: hypothetical protein J6K81_00600 [Rikenellaceae bacterium]|nr:hypothetical protein [Rikenellaceae bacterium]